MKKDNQKNNNRENRIYRNEYIKEKARADFAVEQEKKKENHTKHHPNQAPRKPLSFYQLATPVILLGFVIYTFISIGGNFMGISVQNLFDPQTFLIWGGIFVLFFYLYFFK